MVKVIMRAYIALIIGLSACPPANSAAPAVRFLDPVAQVRPGPKSGTASLRIRLDAPTTEEAAVKDPPKFDDWRLPASLAATVQVTRTIEITPLGDRGRTWQFDLVVDGLDPANTVQRRYAMISLGKETWDLDYQLSNQPPADYKWDIAGLPAEWNLNRNRCAPFRISQSVPSTTGVTLAATLTEETSKQLLGPKTLYLAS